MLKIILVLVFCTFTYVSSMVYKEMYFADPAYPGKCVITNIVLSPGQSMKHPVMECSQITCDNAQGLATIETCVEARALASPISQLKGYDLKNPPSCSWGEFVNTRATYPECCKRHYSCIF